MKGVGDGHSIALKSVLLRLSSSKVGVYGIHINIRMGQMIHSCADKSVSRLNVQEAEGCGLDAN